MRLFPPLLILLLLSLSLCVSSQNVDDARHRMNDLVDSMKDAVKDAESAGHKKEVVDLGQSLHLLESKFAGLRAALSQELGAKAPQLSSHNDVAKELMTKNTNLVNEIVSQRDELRKLTSDVKEVDSAIRALKYGLDTFERDVQQLSDLIREMHISHNELSASHDETKHRLHAAVADSNDKRHKSTHGLILLVLVVELGAFVGYLFLKKGGRNALTHKAYGKYG